MRLRIFSIVLILSLLTVGIFGFMGLGSIDHSGQHNCPISLLSGGNCLPTEDVVLTLVFHHISGLQNLTQSIINSDAFLLIFSALFVFVSLVVLRLSQGTTASRLLPHQIRHRIVESNFIQKKQFLRWLTLRYRRDPHALKGRMM